MLPCAFVRAASRGRLAVPAGVSRYAIGLVFYRNCLISVIDQLLPRWYL